jgi:hypothetical protein
MNIIDYIDLVGIKKVSHICNLLHKSRHNHMLLLLVFTVDAAAGRPLQFIQSIAISRPRRKEIVLFFFITLPANLTISY